MKKIYKFNFNNEKGITLIALAITIAIILILTGVTVALALGDGGIIQDAKDAKRAQELENYKSRIQILVANWEIRMLRDENITINDLWQTLKDEEIINSTEAPDVTTNTNGDYVIQTPAGEIIIENDEDIILHEGGSSGETIGDESGSGGINTGDGD